VSYNGGSYIAVVASANKTPVDTSSFWQSMAKKGDQGVPGSSPVSLSSTKTTIADVGKMDTVKLLTNRSAFAAGPADKDFAHAQP